MQALQTQYMIDEIRSDFPILLQKVNGFPLVYFDHGASTHKPRVVIDSVKHFQEHNYSNVHRGIHELSQQSSQLFEQVRTTVQEFIGAQSSEEIIFTSGTTASINILAQSLSLLLHKGDEIILSQMEHHANIVPWQMIAKQTGAILRIIPISSNGELLLDEYKTLLSSKTKIVSITHLSNVLGTINPVEEIIQLAHKHNAYVHLDGAQAVAHMPINVRKLNVDFYSFSGHKLFAPTGTGVLYGKKHLLEQLTPTMGGGSMIDKVSFEKSTYNDLPYKFEPGTPNISGFIGLGKAIEYIQNIGFSFIQNLENELFVYFQEKIKNSTYQIIGNSAHKAAIFSFIFDSIHPLDVATLLNEYGIAVRTGHHCCQPLIHHYQQSSSMRVSLSFINTKEEIDFFFEKLNHVIQLLQ